MKKFTFLSAILLCTVCMAYGQWTYTSLSEPKSDMGYTSLGNKVWIAGGSNPSGSIPSVEVYDANTGQFSPFGNLLMARGNIAGVACDSKLFFAGGAVFLQTPTANVDIYDTISQQWTVEQLSQGRFMLSAISYGSKVYFAGGFVDFYLYGSDVVDIYDLQTGLWSSDNLSESRGGMAAASLGDIAVFAGGMINQGTFSDQVDIYNFTTDEWISATLSQPRAFAEAAIVGNKILIAGGLSAMGVPSDVVDIYDASTGLWSTASLFIPRALARAATVNGKAYFAGGGTFNFGWSDYSNVIDIYNEADSSWSVEFMAEPRIGHSIAGVGDYLIIAGGDTGEGLTDLVEILYVPYVPHIIHVPGDYPTIQQGIDAALNGDTVLVADGLYYENINFLGKKPLLVTSNFIFEDDTNHIVNTIINGSQPANPEIGSVVTFTNGEDTTSVLCGFTITGGTGTYVSAASARAGGGVFIQYSGGKIINNHIEYNQAKFQGWAIGGGINAGGPISPLPWVVIRNNRINHNKAESTLNDWGEGGGVLCFYNLIMTDNVVSDNKATGALSGQGGGVYIRGDMGTSLFNFSRNIVTYNVAITNTTNSLFSLGGGFEIWKSFGIASGNLIAFNVTESSTSAESDGSGVFIQEVPNSDLLFENNWIINNSFIGGVCYGGGLCLWITGGTYQNNVIQNNAGTYGGGIYMGNSPLNTAILINNTVTGNDAGGGGTGLHLSSSNAVVINSILYNNTPPGPAIFTESSSLEVRYSDVDCDEYVYPGEGNINCDPAFLEDGYHLDPGCQLVNAGIVSIEINGTWYECPPYDIDGELRPWANTQPEIGVDELPEVSIGELISTNNLSVNVYPVPAKDKITIDFPEMETVNNVRISIYGSAGQEMICRDIVPFKSEIDVSSLTPGLYFIKVENNQIISFSKFIKN